MAGVVNDCPVCRAKCYDMEPCECGWDGKPMAATGGWPPEAIKAFATYIPPEKIGEPENQNYAAAFQTLPPTRMQTMSRAYQDTLPLRSECKCGCHDGKCLHFAPCCRPDPPIPVRRDARRLVLWVHPDGDCIREGEMALLHMRLASITDIPSKDNFGYRKAVFVETMEEAK